MEKSLRISPAQARAFLAHHPLRASFDSRMEEQLIFALEGEHGGVFSVVERVIRAFCRKHIVETIVQDFKELEKNLNDPKKGRRIQSYDNDDVFGYRHIPPV